MAWIAAIISAATFCLILALYVCFDERILRLEEKILKQEQTISSLCEVIDKNFMKLANELNKNTKEE